MSWFHRGCIFDNRCLSAGPVSIQRLLTGQAVLILFPALGSARRFQPQHHRIVLIPQGRTRSLWSFSVNGAEITEI